MGTGGHKRDFAIKGKTLEELKEKFSDPVNYFTSYKEIHQWLEKEHNIKLSYEHVHRFVHQYLGAKLKVVRKSNLKKNPVLEEKEVESRSTTQRFWGSHRTNNQSVSLHKQEKPLVRKQDLTGLQVGEFIGTTVEGKEPYCWSRIELKRSVPENCQIQPFAYNVQVQKNYEKIRREAEGIVMSCECQLRRIGRRKDR